MPFTCSLMCCSRLMVVEECEIIYDLWMKYGYINKSANYCFLSKGYKRYESKKDWPYVQNINLNFLSIFTFYII